MEICITSIGIANPAYQIKQGVIADFMIEAHHLEGIEARRLKALYRATGIQSRYSVIPDYGQKPGKFNFFPNNERLEPFPDTAIRMQHYKLSALPLAVTASQNCFLDDSKKKVEEISHLITVSCTGMYAPGLDIDLVNALGISGSVKRTCINFMGCYAAFNALKSAYAVCKGQPMAKVLIVCVELCSLHFQKERCEDNFLANALFGDGAAAVMVENAEQNGKSLAMKSFFCDLLPQGSKDMAWLINNFGFEMKLSSYVPEVIKIGIKNLVKNLREQLPLSSKAFSKYAIHPGGKKILKVIEDELGIDKKNNTYAYEILKAYGNMSSPTILFVIKLILDSLHSEDADQEILALAFGPGLTLESMVLKVH